MKHFDPDTKEFYIDNSKIFLVRKAMELIKEYCEGDPTCDNCPFTKATVLNNPGGCYFRYHSPREWKTEI